VSFPAAINLAILARVLIDVACLNATARENQSVVVGGLEF
jgi:hypothetical protein